MAGEELPTGYLEAGEEYLAAVQKLGLRPRLAGWGWEESSARWLLVLATSIYDAGGPFEMNELLFKAYNAGITPKQISPFIVRVFSPEILPAYALDAIPGEQEYTAHDPMTKEETARFKGYITLDLYGTKVSALHLYHTKNIAAPMSYMERQREWQKFRKNVEKLAA
ncbi:MAG: hypothetical protein JOZ72_19645 [Alphaproteobacteria bacterium]|nr:hypothetical protein [Alphaproteobacteria bacterium]